MLQPDKKCVNDYLSPKHREALQKRGLSDTTIDVSEIFTVDDSYVIARMLNYRVETSYGIGDRSCPNPLTAKFGSCQVIPYHHLIDADGKPLEHYRLRPDNPIDPKRKYEAPRGERIHPYFPPGIIALFGDTSIPLIITEGEFKSLILCQNGFACIAIPGVACWGAKGRGRNNRRLLHEDLMRIAWRGRTVIILFDSDIATNQNVEREAKALKACLEWMGARAAHIVRLPHVPGKKAGADDFIQGNGPDALEKLIRKSLSHYRRKHQSPFICPHFFGIYKKGDATSPTSPYNPKKCGQFNESANDYILVPDVFPPQGKCQNPGLTLLLEGKYEREKRLGIDKVCGKPDCPRCNAPRKTDANHRLVAFLSHRGFDAVSVLQCSNDDWRKKYARTLKRKYGLAEHHYAYLRFKDRAFILSMLPIKEEKIPFVEMTIPEAFQEGKQFIRGMNPDGPYQTTVHIPEPVDDDEDSAGDKEVPEFALKGVTGKNVCGHRRVLDNHRIDYEDTERHPDGVTDGVVWNVEGVSQFTEQSIYRDIELKPVSRRKKPTDETHLDGEWDDGTGAA